MQDIQIPRTIALPGLIGLRGVGALWVMVFHAQYGMKIPIADQGYLGVDLFFILSGFVLSHANIHLHWNWRNYRNFVRNRAARIFPLHWAAMSLLLLALLIYPAIYANMRQKFEWQSFISSILLMQNWGFGQLTPWNAPAWSLSTEWLVSLAFPLFLAISRSVRHAVVAAILCAACLGIFSVFLIISGNIIPDVAHRAGVLRTICEFAAGCLLYRVHLAKVEVSAAVVLGSTVLLLSGLLIPQLAILAVFGFPVLILLAARPDGIVSRSLSGRAITFLGNISFSIYLTHWIVLIVSEHLRKSFGFQGFAAFLWFCGYLGVVLLLSSATYRWVEMPAQLWLRTRKPVVASGQSRVLA